MKILLYILTFALILKDVQFLGDPFFLRGGAEIVMLLVGIWLLVSHFSINIIKRQWLVFIYLIMLTVSILFSPFKVYTFLQVVAQSAVLIFFISLSSFSYQKRIFYFDKIATTMIFGYFLVCLLSLIVYVINPSLVTIFVIGDGYRFAGIYNMPGMLGVSSGLLVGLSLLKPMPIWLKVFIVAVGSACVVATLSRTFVVALLIGMIVTSWFYFPKFRKLYLMGAVGVVSILVVLSAFNFSLSQDKQKQITSLGRTHSIEGLNGRTEMWERVIGERAKNPFHGEGYSMGGLVLIKKKTSQLNFDSVDPRSLGRVTLHSGYIQALADLGWIGFLIYFSVIIIAVIRPIIFDKHRIHPILCFSAIYLMIANSAESIIYTSSNFYSLYFWLVAIMLNSLRFNRSEANESIRK